MKIHDNKNAMDRLSEWMMTHKAEHTDALRAYLIGALIPLVSRREFSDAFDRAEEFCIQQFGEALAPEKPLDSDDVTKVN